MFFVTVSFQIKYEKDCKKFLQNCLVEISVPLFILFQRYLPHAKFKILNVLIDFLKRF